MKKKIKYKRANTPEKILNFFVECCIRHGITYSVDVREPSHKGSIREISTNYLPN